MEVNEIGNKYVGMDSSMLMEMAHSKHASESQKVAAVSQQFESVLVKQFLKEALKPMFKGFSIKMVMPTESIATFSLMPYLKASPVVVVLEFPISFSSNFPTSHLPKLNPIIKNFN